jgi:SAM-dependent methyltransferase
VSQDCYADAAEHYERGRLPYPSALESLVEAAVGRGGRLLDLGCGPGTVGLRLAGLYDELVGVDRDPGMVELARNRAAATGLESARFVHASVEHLPADLGTFRVITVAQAFHWFDGPRAAEAIAGLLEPGGRCVVLYAWSLTGDPAPDIALPTPPYAEMEALCARLLGAGGGPPRTAPNDEAGAMTAAGLAGPDSWQVPGGEVIVSSDGDLMARWLSRSDAAELRTGPRRVEYTAAAEKILRAASDAGFSERLRDARFNVWTKSS